MLVQQSFRCVKVPANTSSIGQSSTETSCPIQYGLRLSEAVSKKQSDEGYYFTVGYSTRSHSKEVHEGQTLPPDLGSQALK